MLQKRIDACLGQSRKGGRRIDIRKRHQFLLDIEGWYKIKPDPVVVLPDHFKPFYKSYTESSSSLKFTRWVARNKLAKPEEIAQIGTLLKDVNFKLSCRHKDFLRLAETNNYKTCFKDWRGAQQTRYLADPDLILCFVPDAAGKYMWRALVRLMLHENEHCLLFYRSYGNSNHQAILNRVNDIMPVYVGERNLHNSKVEYTPESSNEVELVSATKHNNKVVGIHVWSDHRCQLKEDNRLHMYGYKWQN